MVIPLVLGSSSPEQSRSGPDAVQEGTLGRWGNGMVKNRSGGNWFNGIRSTQPETSSIGS